jgi:hypothetical protein
VGKDFCALLIKIDVFNIDICENLGVAFALSEKFIWTKKLFYDTI